MRFRVPELPKWNEKRTKTAYLWLPKCIDYEWRWLEVASWEDRWDYCNWKARKWVNE